MPYKITCPITGDTIGESSIDPSLLGMVSTKGWIEVNHPEMHKNTILENKNFVPLCSPDKIATAEKEAIKEIISKGLEVPEKYSKLAEQVILEKADTDALIPEKIK